LRFEKNWEEPKDEIRVVVSISAKREPMQQSTAAWPLLYQPQPDWSEKIIPETATSEIAL
jgi:hypothetical protein